MGRITRTLGFGIGLSLLGAAGAWADTIINFDTFANGTNINNAYAGLTFSCFSSVNACNGANSGNVYVRSSSAATSAPNIVSTLQTGVPGTQDSTTGAIEIHFATAQSAVSIADTLFQASEAFGTSGFGYLQAYDSSLNFLGEVDDSYGGNAANLNVSKTLSLAFAGDISYVLLGDVQGANIISAFDNLCYSTSVTGCSIGGGNNNGGNNGVPEPAALSMILPGLAALIGLKFRRKQPAGSF